MVKPFEEIVKELEEKYNVSVDPAVLRAVIKVVERDLKDLVAKRRLSLDDVQAYFKRIYPKVWCFRAPLRSVDALILQVSKDLDTCFSSAVGQELNKLYVSLTADTLFAASAFVVLTRGRKENPGDATVTMDDVEKVCEKFLMLKPEWLC